MNLKQLADERGIEQINHTITQEQINAMQAQFEAYKKAENAREKEFRDLERKVYVLEQSQALNVFRVYEPNPQSWTSADHSSNGAATQQGVVWLR